MKRESPHTHSHVTTLFAAESVFGSRAIDTFWLQFGGLTFCLLAVGPSSASLVLLYEELWLFTRPDIAEFTTASPPFTLFTVVVVDAVALPPAAEGGVVKDLVTGTMAPPPLV